MPEVTGGKEMFQRGSKSFDKSAASALTFPNIGIAQQAALSYLVNRALDRQCVRILTAINAHSCRRSHCPPGRLRKLTESIFFTVSRQTASVRIASPFRSAATWPQDFLREGSQRTAPLIVIQQDKIYSVRFSGHR
jgi:hypothetical protein